MEFTALCGAIGVEVRGVDLNDTNSETEAAIKGAFDSHGALMFRGQSLSPESQKRFSSLFGDVFVHPLRTRATVDGHPEVLILENRPGRPGAPNDYWHSDISHMAEPPSATVLHALAVPEGHGDTMICNMARAYEQLSDGLKQMIAGLKAYHSGKATQMRSVGAKTDARPIDPAELKPPQLHPVARSVAGTNQKAIFVNPRFTIGIDGLEERESAWLLNLLYEVATKPENIYRHRWQVGDVLIWDNRRTMHYAVRDYTEDMHRKLHRCTAQGEAPV